jgi:CubicO group peptidase (beta-lactamase class C family)
MSMQDTVKSPKSAAFPLPSASAHELGFHPPALDRLRRTIEAQIAEGRYPGAQIALARHGKLALAETYGLASLEPKAPARDDTLWLMFSNTKVITAAGIWALAEEGALRFTDRVADHIPEFAKNGKGEITIVQLLSHRGGFPSADVPPAGWTDHALMRKTVCDFTLEWTPGSRLVYHGRAAHFTAAMVIEAIAKTDYRDFLRTRIIEPLGLGRDLFVGLPDAEHGRAVAMHEPTADGKQTALADLNTPSFRKAGLPGSGGYGTARAMAAFYQMMAQEGRLNGVRLFSPRLIQYVTRNITGDMVDGFMGMPMHRGLGPHLRGTTDTVRGLGSFASPRTFGHGGVGSSYCWADPDSGVSFAYFTNSRIPDPWHSQRMDVISNLVHSAID